MLHDVKFQLLPFLEDNKAVWSQLPLLSFHYEQLMFKINSTMEKVFVAEKEIRNFESNTAQLRKVSATHNEIVRQSKYTSFRPLIFLSYFAAVAQDYRCNLEKLFVVCMNQAHASVQSYQRRASLLGYVCNSFFWLSYPAGRMLVRANKK